MEYRPNPGECKVLGIPPGSVFEVPYKASKDKAGVISVKGASPRGGALVAAGGSYVRMAGWLKPASASGDGEVL